MPCGQEENVKVKRGRPKKKPGYDRDEEIVALQTKALELFGEPFDDRIERSGIAPSIRDVAVALNITPLKARKILITAGYYSTELSRKVQKLHEDGCTTQEIMEQTGLKWASVHAYLPYVKGIYNLPEPPLNAERRRIYRKRLSTCERLKCEIDSPDVEKYLWDAIVAFADYPFKTENGLSMKYTVRDGEIFFNRKAKNVTWETVIKAFHQARELQKEKGNVDGQKEFGTFGASYLYPVFLRLGVCSKKKGIIKKQ